jgi:hypothetical protein
VDEIIEGLKAKGVKIVKEPQKVFWADTALILPTWMIINGKWRITLFLSSTRMGILSSKQKETRVARLFLFIRQVH